jgi:hypothetical protein
MHSRHAPQAEFCNQITRPVFTLLIGLRPIERLPHALELLEVCTSSLFSKQKKQMRKFASLIQSMVEHFF